MLDDNKIMTSVNRLRGNLKEAADKYKALRRIKVNVPNGCGAEITATKDGQTVKGTEKNGVVYIDIPSYGLWTLTGKTIDGAGDPVSVDVKNTQQYEVSMRFKVKISKEISVRFPDYITNTNSHIEIKGKGAQSGYSRNQFSTLENGALVAKFLPPDVGEYTITPYAHFNNMLNPGEVINLTVTENVGQSFDAKFAGFRVSTKIGAKLTIKPQVGTTRIEDITKDNELFIVYLAGGRGTFTLSSTVDGASAQTVTKEVTLNGFEIVNVELPFPDAPPPPPPKPEPSFKTYGININNDNENPDTRLTYTGDAIGIEPGWENWKNEYMFSQIRPCIVKDGKVVKYLQQDNRTLYEDGTPAVLDDPSVGDVMIEFPKIGFRIHYDVDYGTGTSIYITNNPKNLNQNGYYNISAFSNTNCGDCDHVYVSAYLADTSGNSISGISPKTCHSDTTDVAWTIVDTKNNSSSSEMWGLYDFKLHTLLQCLFMLIYKTTNGQSALGFGQQNRVPNGSTNDKPFCWGDPTDPTKSLVFLGIENFWSINLPYWLGNYGGIWETNRLYHSSTIRKVTQEEIKNNYNWQDWKTKYFSNASQKFQGYCGCYAFDNNSGFVDCNYPKTGSSSTYFCDYQQVDPTFYSFGHFVVGGYPWGEASDKQQLGPFCMYISDFYTSKTYARLVCKPKSV